MSSNSSTNSSNSGSNTTVNSSVDGTSATPNVTKDSKDKAFLKKPLIEYKKGDMILDLSNDDREFNSALRGIDALKFGSKAYDYELTKTKLVVKKVKEDDIKYVAKVLESMIPAYSNSIKV